MNYELVDLDYNESNTKFVYRIKGFYTYIVVLNDDDYVEGPHELTDDLEIISARVNLHKVDELEKSIPNYEEKLSKAERRMQEAYSYLENNIDFIEKERMAKVNL
ncbi:MAG: hypothetical protein IKF82_01305 [Bacilli bacterium]|nr:hypothetical protein [Bacilli bacterium]